jgi:hypothetical protein
MANIKFSQFTNDTNPNSSSFFVGYNSVSNLNVRVSKANLLSSLGAITGSGTTNKLPKFTAGSTIGDSAFFDDGTNQGTETTTAINRFIISANASIAKIFSFRSANLPRWAFRVDGTESGANAGADLAIRRYDDAGTFIDAPLSINRSSGQITLTHALNINTSTAGLVLNRPSVTTFTGKSLLTNGVGQWFVGMRENLSSNDYVIYNESGFDNFKLNKATGAATFSSSVTTGADATINGVAVGRGAGNLSGNTAVGVSSLNANTSGDFNVSIGNSALSGNTSGQENVANGVQALFQNTTGSFNVAIGNVALGNNIVGSYNTAIGRSSLNNNTASNNTAVGFEAGYNNTSGTITAIGFRALKANVTGERNTAIGKDALLVSDGVDNTAVGFEAQNTGTGGFNTTIGSRQTNAFSATSMIGAVDTATGDNQMRFGSSAIVNGAVATEVLVSDRSWSVFINGTAYKILLKA